VRCQPGTVVDAARVVPESHDVVTDATDLHSRQAFCPMHSETRTDYAHLGGDSNATMTAHEEVLSSHGHFTPCTRGCAPMPRPDSAE